MSLLVNQSINNVYFKNSNNKYKNMSIKLDPREVLQYLNELGYCNVTATQLKEFMKDLKILIKYDRKKYMENQENRVNNFAKYNENEFVNLFQADTCAQTNLKTNNVQTNTACSKRGPNLKSVASSDLYSASTVSSRARSIAKDVYKPSCSKSKQTNFVNDGNSQTDTRVFPSACTFTSITDGYTDDFSIDTRSEMEYHPKERAKSVASGTGLKPRVSFIRPRKPVSSTKSDPVALYHHYQAEWKKQKLPGEDKHSELRWAIRARMLGEPSIKPSSVFFGTSHSKRLNRL